MVETTPLLPKLPPMGGKAVAARFDGRTLSSDAGLLALREVERKRHARPLLPLLI
jgi:hypothetical protein